MSDNDNCAALPAPNKETLELTAKVIALLVGVAYVLGLFIVNFHLGLYGIRSSGLLRADYVLAGGTWLFLFFFTGLLWRDVYQTFTHNTSSVPAKVAKVLLRFPIYLILMAFAIVALSAPTFNRDTYAMLVALGIVATSPIVLAYPLTVVIAIARLLLRLDRQKGTLPIFVLAFFAVILILMLAMYSAGVYPILSPAFGGGSAIPVQIRLRSDTAPEVQADFAEVLSRLMAPRI
jgi:hypothetical protein